MFLFELSLDWRQGNARDGAVVFSVVSKASHCGPSCKKRFAFAVTVAMEMRITRQRVAAVVVVSAAAAATRIAPSQILLSRLSLAELVSISHNPDLLATPHLPPPLPIPPSQPPCRNRSTSNGLHFVAPLIKSLFHQDQDKPLAPNHTTISAVSGLDDSLSRIQDRNGYYQFSTTMMLRAGSPHF
jgi:hypothetical protein